MKAFALCLYVRLWWFCRGHGGPHDAGHYNSRSWETGFFVSHGGNWQSEYGHFFLSWYSGLLVKHANRVLGAAAEVLNKPGRPRLIKSFTEVRERGGGLGVGALWKGRIGNKGSFCMEGTVAGDGGSS